MGVPADLPPPTVGQSMCESVGGGAIGPAETSAVRLGWQQENGVAFGAAVTAKKPTCLIGIRDTKVGGNDFIDAVCEANVVRRRTTWRVGGKPEGGLAFLFAMEIGPTTDCHGVE